MNIDPAALSQLLGVASTSFNDTNITAIVPLNTDGTEGENHTNGVYGGWFDKDGNPRYFAEGHVYIEVFSDLLHWNCGLQQALCSDSQHTVTMQLQYHDGTVLKKVNIKVVFAID